MRRTLILLLLALALGASTGRAQSVVLVPSRDDGGALCLARVTLDANDAVEAIDTFELPLILGRPANGIEVHPSGRILLSRLENTVANPNDALDWVTVSAGPLTYEDALTWRGLAPEDWVLEPMNASERKRLWSQARREIDAHLRTRPGMALGGMLERADVGMISRMAGTASHPVARLDVSFSLSPTDVPHGYRNSTMAAVLMNYRAGRAWFFPTDDKSPKTLKSVTTIQHGRYYVGIEEESLQATEIELLRAESLAPGIKGQRVIVLDGVEGKTLLESDPFYVGMGGERPMISPDGKWVLCSGSALPFDARKLPHGGEGLHLIEVATGTIQRLTPPDVRAGVGCWFPDSERFFATLRDSVESRLPDRIVLGGLDGSLKPWSTQPSEELVLAILSMDQASEWSPSLDRFLVSGMGKQDGSGGKIGGFVTIRRVTVATAELSVVVEVPFERILEFQGRRRSLAWLFPSGAPSSD